MFIYHFNTTLYLGFFVIILVFLYSKDSSEELKARTKQIFVDEKDRLVIFQQQIEVKCKETRNDNADLRCSIKLNACHLV